MNKQVNNNALDRNNFFIKDIGFYKSLTNLLIVISLQNIIAYSVNMTDNIMLGSYSQTALAGATTVNQIFFVVQQLTLGIGNALVILASQYWGKQKIEPIASLTHIALKVGIILSLVIIIPCSLYPQQILGLFTNSTAIINAGCEYLDLMKWTFLLFILSNILLATLRSIEIVKIAFYISIITLILNAGINYTLIFGHFGFAEMGVKGSSIGTLIARFVEFVIVIVYITKSQKHLKLFADFSLFKHESNLSADFQKVVSPLLLSQLFWAVSIPIQTAILGHLSDDAIVANSIATTFFQYLKVIVVAMSSASSVLIGIAIGRGDMQRIKAEARTMAGIDIILGILLAIGLYLCRYPLISMYNLTPSASELTINLIVVMSIIMVGMSYQMPVSIGLIQGGGDTKFVMKMNLISIWLIVIPLSFLAAFVWHWSIIAVVFVIQSDQIFKCIPTYFRFKSYKWIKVLAK